HVFRIDAIKIVIGIALSYYFSLVVDVDDGRGSVVVAMRAIANAALRLRVAKHQHRFAELTEKVYFGPIAGLLNVMRDRHCKPRIGARVGGPKFPTVTRPDAVIGGEIEK